MLIRDEVANCCIFFLQEEYHTFWLKVETQGRAEK